MLYHKCLLGRMKISLSVYEITREALLVVTLGTVNNQQDIAALLFNYFWM